MAKDPKKPVLYPCKLEHHGAGSYSVLVEASADTEFSDFQKLLIARSLGIGVNHASDVKVLKTSNDFFNLTGYSHRLTISL